MRYSIWTFILIAIFICQVNPAKSDDAQQCKECKTKATDEIKEYRYARVILLLEDFLKTAKDKEIIKEINGYKEDINGEMAIFNNMIKSLADVSKPRKILIDGTDILITKADESGIEGNADDTSCTKRWVDISPKQILDLFPPGAGKMDNFYLGIWCYNHSLTSKGESILIKWLSDNSGEKWRLDRFLCRYGNIPVPPGGFAEYNGQLVTRDEKTEIMALEQLRKQLMPKGVIDKPGADKEQLSWQKARTKKTEHYIVKTNLSTDALNDLCFVMECFYSKVQKIFKITIKTGQFNINFFRTKEEYVKNEGPADACGVFVYDPNTAEAQILAYYDPPDNASTLMHEGTHQLVRLACGSYEARAPKWLSEGLATYFEASKYNGTMLKTNLIHESWLEEIQERITDKKTAALADFITMDKDDLELSEYAHVWSLVYFFINYNYGQYTKSFDAYFGAIRKKGLNALADKKQHIKMFEESFKTTFEVLEKEWQEYILKLKPNAENE